MTRIVVVSDALFFFRGFIFTASSSQSRSQSCYNPSALVEIGSLKKGDVLTVAKIAAIQAAKKTSDLIPLCHNINLNKIDIEFNIDTLEKKIDCKSSVECFSKTGAEMEALTAVSVALLTIYDMCKASDKNMLISEIKLLEKRGGKSGTWVSKT